MDYTKLNIKQIREIIEKSNISELDQVFGFKKSSSRKMSTHRKLVIPSIEEDNDEASHKIRNKKDGSEINYKNNLPINNSIIAKNNILRFNDRLKGINQEKLQFLKQLTKRTDVRGETIIAKHDQDSISFFYFKDILRRAMISTQIIDFYSILLGDKFKDNLYISCHFFTNLMSIRNNKTNGFSFNSVKSFFKESIRNNKIYKNKVDLFSKHYIFAPISKDVHFTYVKCDLHENIISYHDSLSNNSSTKLLFKKLKLFCFLFQHMKY